MSESIKLAIKELAPTQLTAGMREVDRKRLRWRRKHDDRAAEYFDLHPFPVILGPAARHYLIDRHHLTRALFEEDIRVVSVSIVADLSALSPDEFWAALEMRSWTHPYDERGVRRTYDELPRSIEGLVDDPYRSLAGALKRAGGYAKDKAPFSEFRWADYLGCHIPHEWVERDFDRALWLVMSLADSTNAASLPGWRRHSEPMR